MLLSSCYSTTHSVSWTKEKKYELYFLTESDIPIAGVHVDCKLVEEGKTFETATATSYFSESTTSDENGFLVVHQRPYKEGSSYNHIGSYQWAYKHSKPKETICNFYLHEKLIYSSNMSIYVDRSKNTIYINSKS